MNSTEATEKQIELYQQMTGEQRLLIGLRLHELSCNIAREGIRSAHPNATDDRVEELLRVRIKAGYQICGVARNID